MVGRIIGLSLPGSCQILFSIKLIGSLLMSHHMARGAMIEVVRQSNDFICNALSLGLTGIGGRGVGALRALVQILGAMSPASGKRLRKQVLVMLSSLLSSTLTFSA